MTSPRLLLRIVRLPASPAMSFGNTATAKLLPIFGTHPGPVIFWASKASRAHLPLILLRQQ
jgi:hypothetical protein